MNELIYLLEKLTKLLTKEEIEVNDDRLLEVIHVYDKLYSFIKDNKLIHDYEFKTRFNFVHSKNLDINDETNLEIFKSLLELESFKGLYILDYPMILHKITSSFTYNNYIGPIEKLELLLSSYLTYFYSEYDDLEEKYILAHDDALDNIINNYYQDIIDSKHVSSDEKDIIAKYNELYIHYHMWFGDGDYEYLFILLMNVSYAYFVANNKIIHEYKEVMDFLDKTDKNLLEIISKIIVSGIDTEEEMLCFIKSFYQNYKILNKKQIK